MALLLEFLIAFFGVPWLLYKLISGKARERVATNAANRYQNECDALQGTYGATKDECAIAKQVIATGITYNQSTFLKKVQSERPIMFGDDAKYPDYHPGRDNFMKIKDYPGLYAEDLVSLIRDDMLFIFGPNTRILEGGKYHPENEHIFRRRPYVDQYHGKQLMIMLIIAKMGKIPHISEYGWSRDTISLFDHDEIRFLQRVEWTLQKNGVDTDFILQEHAGDFYRFKYRQAWPSASGSVQKVW